MNVPTEIAIERLKDTSTKKRVDAKIPPKGTPSLSFTFFNFMRENENLTTERSGMQGYSTGIDRDKLTRVAKEYEIDLSRYLPIVSYYEGKMIEQQNREFEKQKS